MYWLYAKIAFGGGVVPAIQNFRKAAGLSAANKLRDLESMTKPSLWAATKGCNNFILLQFITRRKLRRGTPVGQIIHIQWEGPFNFRELPSLDDAQKDYGIYQVYACHPVYGSGSLVYIGMAARQTFGRRIQQHGWGTGSEPDPERLKF